MHVHTIQLNIEKLLGGTIHMDAAEFGAYMSLIISAYQCKNQLPKDDKRLARMARVSSHKWSKIKGVVLEKFDDKGDFYEQKFVKNDIQRIESLSKKNKANRLKRNRTGLPVVDQSYYQKATNTSNKEQIYNNNNIDQSIKVSIVRELSKIINQYQETAFAGNYSQVDLWLSRGYNPNTVILPVIKSISERQGRFPNSLKYFDPALAEEHEIQTNPKKTERPVNGKSTIRKTQSELADEAAERARSRLLKAEEGVSETEH